MGIIREYLRNPATFKRRQIIGCLGGCIGTPIIFGLILLIIWAVNVKLIDNRGFALLAFAGIVGFFVLMLIVLGLWIRMRNR